MVKLKPKKVINGVTARLPVVQNELVRATGRIASVAEIGLSQHRSNKDNQHHSVGTGQELNKKYGSIDHVVFIEGPAPVSMELGHQNAQDGSQVRGLYILARAAGIF